MINDFDKGEFISNTDHLYTGQLQSYLDNSFLQSTGVYQEIQSYKLRLHIQRLPCKNTVWSKGIEIGEKVCIRVFAYACKKSEIQLNPAIMDVKRPTNFIHYNQISVIADIEIKRN